ncbi:thiosulfate:glutathione sulfurtransferase [Pangasianodon hypophthalmus]|uniref:thiosulfate:glutathione sulfurtransferase n=1 Tax=Pangasianodon hypophthalmus TaxID=310915 RepID=UPI000EFF72E5|nr:thiosulfate:glutathione sulfurtransferase [Pangasianodon hypophthalmus]
MMVYPILRRVIVSMSAFRPVHCVGLRAGLRTSCIHHTRKEKSDLDSVVTYEQLKMMLANHSVQLFDIRNRDEFLAGHIPDSVNIPLGQLEESLMLSPEQFEKLFKVKAPKKEDDNIVFHCQRGRRSLTALETAWRLGFSRARHYAGGYSEWVEKEKQ